MSSISGLGSSAQGLYSFIQSLSGSNQTSATSATPSTGSTPSAALGQVAGAGGHHHHHGGGGAFKQIQDAVTTALQSSQKGGDSSADPNKIIEDAIAKILQNNTSASGGAPQGAGNANGDADGSAGSASAVNGQSFQQLLQSFGVSPQQFRQDFLSAVKDAQGGQMNPATALQSFPVGSTLDLVG